MTKMKLGDKVKTYNSQCIGIIIHSTTIEGTIVKVNAKSVVVEYNHILVKHGNKVVTDTDYCGKKNFKYWKTCKDGRIFYKNELDGIITF